MIQISTTKISASKVSTVFAFLLLLFFQLPSFAEGTKQLMPNSNDDGYLTFYPRYNAFAQYNASESERLHITICNPGEVIYYGMQSWDENNRKWRLKDPNGNIVVAEADIPKSTADVGYIDSYNEAVAGPSQIVGATGYNAMSYTTLMAGDYYLEFFIDGNRTTLPYFDITVADGANGTAIDGRVWSKAWCMSTESFNNSFDGTLYMYSNDMIVTALDFNGIRPYVFVITANSTGVNSTGNFTEDRKSVFGYQYYAEYKIFLNDPDINCFPTGEFGSLTQPSTITGCGNDKCINVFSDKAGSVLILLDFNGVPGYQPNTADLQLAQDVVAGQNCIAWDSYDGLGNFVGNGSAFTLQVDYLNGITHLPMTDVERHYNGYSVSLVRPAGAAPKIFWDDSNIWNSTDLTGCLGPCHTWDVNEGNDNTINTWWYANIEIDNLSVVNINLDVDANVNIPGKGSDNDTLICKNSGTFDLFGEVVGALGGQWTTSGTGVFSSSGTDQKGTYTPSAADYSSGSITLTLTSTGNGTCPPDSDFMTINFSDAPTMDIGPPQTVCENDLAVDLNATFTVATGVEWIGGTGIFVPSRFDPNPTYTASASEIAAGTVTLTATSTNNGICNPESDDIVVTIETAPTVDAGSPGGPQSVCDNNTLIQLAGSFSNANTVTWSGSGVFSDVNSPTSTYQPTTTEINSGSFTLTITTDAPGSCLPESDNIDFVIVDGPTVNAGNPILGCTNSDTIQLTGTTTVASGAIWSGGTGTFLPDVTTLNAQYILTTADKTSGTVKLYLTSTGNGICAPEEDSVIITIQAAPVVTISSTDDVVCANNAVVDADVNIVGSSGGVWSGGTGIFTPNTSATTISYIPSSTEIASNFAAIIFTATDLAGCSTVSDTLEIVILPTPIVMAGPDQSICKNNTDVSLSGTVILADQSEWLGQGGSFTSNPIDNPVNVYQPNQTDLNNGVINLVLQATKDKCNPVYDTMEITFTDSPVIVPGPSQSVCANNPNTSLSAAILIATGVEWTGGSNNFTNPTGINTDYTPSASEISAGVTEVYVTTTGNGNCLPVSDTVDIIITPAPTVDVGPDQTVCFNNARTSITGVLTVATQAIWSGGVGTYQSNKNDLTLNYTPKRSEKNNGSVTLTLTTIDNGNCLPESDDITITITPRPTLGGFPNKSICGDESVDYSINLTNATGVIISGGNGTFSPDNTSTTFTYTPSAAEILAGSVDLTATTTGNGDCNPISRTRTVTIQSIPSVNAGSDLVLCSDVASVTLDGTSENVPSVQWTTSGSGTFGNANQENTTYSPSTADFNSGSVVLTLTGNASGQCGEVVDEMTLSFTTATAIVAGADQTVCSNSFPVLLGATGSPGTWTGGNGTFNPDRTTLNAQYTPTAAEVTAGSVTLTITTAASGACPSVSDDMTIMLLEGPTANAGADQTICASSTVTLAGAISDATGGFWTTNGSGNFSNTADLTGTYTPSFNDASLTDTTTIEVYLSTTGNAPCPADTDTMLITLAPQPVIDAGPNQTICADGAQTLSGSFTNTTGITWSGGTGAYSNVNDKNSTYAPSPADTVAGSITITLTSDATSVCPAISDDMVLTFSPVPTANVGTDLVVCADTAYIPLNGTVTQATNGNWFTDGDGSFSPTATALNTDYYPTAVDTANGTVKLWMSSVGNGVCNGTSDTLIVDLTPAPIITAGPDQTLCADVATISVVGTLTNVTQGIWSSNGTGTFADANGLTTTYTPSAADRLLNTILFTFTTVDHGLCKEYSDQMLVTITPPPTVNAGYDQTLCANVTNVQLQGDVTISGGIQWTTSGSGTFSPNDTDLDAIYTPSSADTTAGSIELVASTTQNGLCQAVQDTVLIVFNSVPTIEAGVDHVICADSSAVQLMAVTQNTTGITWSTSGSGNFFTSQFEDTVQYAPSNADTTARTVDIYLTSDAGICASVIDTLTIDITPQPFVTISQNLTVCADSVDIALAGTVTNATGLAWTTSGTGTISDTSLLTPTYTPSSIDLLAGNVQLTITSVGNGLCHPVSTSMQIDFEELPTVSAGTDAVACAENSGVTLNGSITNATGAFWTSTGTGTFGPDSLDIQATYYPSAADTVSKSMELVLTTLTNGICDDVSDTMMITIQPLPIVNAGDDISICADTSLVQLDGTISNALGGQWSILNGSGVLSDVADLKAFYSPSTLDTANGSVTLILQSIGNGKCGAGQDTVMINIAPEPTVFAGNNFVDCADAEFFNLAGTSSNASYTTWTTNGKGQFSNDNDLSTTYALQNGDSLLTQISFTLTAVDTVNGCKTISDNVSVNLTPIPTLNAGNDLEVCTGIASVPLSGVVTNATGGRWVMVNTPTGSFSPSQNQLSTNYIPSAADFATGSVLLRLYTTGTGQCKTYNDEVLISFSDTPPIDAGQDKTVCTTDLPVSLDGGGNSGVWVGGLGTFTPDRNTSNALYQPDATEITAGFVTLTRNTNNNGTCALGSDQVTISFTDGPQVTINAGANIEVCTDETSIAIDGSVTVAGGVIWSTSGSGTFDVETDAATNYNLTPVDIANGSVILKLTTTNNGLCNAQSDELEVTFRKAPTVDAGSDRIVCADNPIAQLDGAFTNATGVTWSGGTGFTDPNSATSTYTASASEISNGSVTLTLTTSGHPNCSPATDDMVFTIIPTPEVTINNDTLICESHSTFQLDATITNALGGRWSTAGTGFFAPNDTALNAVYVPSDLDRTNGTVVISLFSEGNGLCNAVSESFTLTFQAITNVTTPNATLDICENETLINITSTPVNAGGVLWETAGNGTFADATASSTTYTPSAQDLLKKSVILIINSTGNGACDTAQTTLTLDFAPLPEVNAGFDFDVCANANQLALNGSFTTASDAVWGTYNGAGSFSPDVNTMNAAYLPTAADTTQGFVDITLTTSATVCPSQIDTIHVELMALPIVFAGDTLDVCDDTTGLALIGQVSNATGGIWTTSGDGTFSTSDHDLNATYVLGANDFNLDFIGITLTNTGNNLCPKTSDALIVALSNQPDAFVNGLTTACINATDIEINATATNQTAVTWSTITGGTFTDDSNLSTFYQPSDLDRSNGYIDLTVTVDGMKTCKPVEELVQIDYQQLPVLNAGPDKSYCANNAIALYNGAVDYGTTYWSTGGTGRFEVAITDLQVTYFPSASDTAQQTLVLFLNTLGDDVCESISDSLVITFVPQPYLIPTKGVLCDIHDGVIVEVGINNGNPGIWSTNGTGAFSPDNTNFNAQYYPSQDDFDNGRVDIKFATDMSMGCNIVEADMSITIEPQPIAAAGSDLYTCRNSDVTLDAFIEDDVTYEWTTLGGTVLGNTPSISVNAANSESIILTATDHKGCFTKDTVDLNVYDLPTFNLPTPFCFNDTLFLDSDPQNIPNVPGSFQWYKDNVLQVGQNTSINYISDAGDYTISYSYQACSIEAQSQVFALPVISTSDEIGCTNELTRISTTDLANVTYTWTDGTSNVGTGFAIDITTLQDTTQYFVTASDNNNCISTDSLFVIGIVKPIIDLVDTSACSDELITLSSAPINYNDISMYSPTYSWFDNTTNLNNATDKLDVDTDGLYIGKIVIGQCIASDTSAVTFNPRPVSLLPDEEQVFCDNDTVGIVLDAGPSTKYYWFPTTDTTRTTLATEEQMYFVTLTNQFGCETQDSVSVYLVCPPLLHTPTAFTPGIAGGDRDFIVFSKYITEFDLTIYNRWGEVIFHTNDINEGWDGTYLGDEMPVGTYPWVIKYRGRGEYNDWRIQEGRVTLLK